MCKLNAASPMHQPSCRSLDPVLKAFWRDALLHKLAQGCGPCPCHQQGYLMGCTLRMLPLQELLDRLQDGALLGRT